jgi:hypothetical protein
MMSKRQKVIFEIFDAYIIIKVDKKKKHVKNDVKVKKAREKNKMNH